MKPNFTSAVRAGLVATLAMTVLILMAPLMGMPKMHIGAMLAMFMKVPVAVGWAMHFVIGVMLAGGYAIIFVRGSNASSVLRGMLFSLIPWLMAQTVMMPMMGAGLFSGSAMMAGGSLMGHLFYGAILGAMYKPRATLNSADNNVPRVAV